MFRGGTDVPEWTKGVGDEATIYVSNAHEIKRFLRHFPESLRTAIHFNLIEKVNTSNSLQGQTKVCSWNR